MKSLIVATVVLAAISHHSQASFSDVLRIAHIVGCYAGYTPSKSRKIDYEITDKPDHQTYNGYKTVQIRVNNHAVFDLSIKVSTGQVVDFNRCLIVNYPVIKDAERRSVFHKGREILYAEMMGNNGCDHYRVLNHPGDEANTSPVYSIDKK